MEARTVHDPFLGKDVEISDNLTDRLRGKYACGPMLPSGEPEFGWRQMPQIPIQIEAADCIDDLRHQLWLLLGDVKARSVSCTCYPPLTKDERYHIDRAEALLTDYNPEE